MTYNCVNYGVYCPLLHTVSCLTLTTTVNAHLPLLCLEFSPPASPLSGLYPSFCAEDHRLREVDPVPAWDWSVNWMEEMEAQYRAHYPGRNTKSFNT